MIERGASPDLAKLSKMVKTVERIEDNKALANYYMSSSWKTENNTSSYLRKRSKDKWQNGSYVPYCCEGPYEVGNPNKRFKSEPTKPKTLDKGKEQNQALYQRQAPKEANNKPTAGPSKPTHGKLCFACGKSGHFANDPTCKRYGKSQLFAIREDEEINSLSDNELVVHLVK